jgi:AcrR family transcriptional regulator
MAEKVSTSRPRKLTRQERADRTRARIVQAAHRLILEHGYEATTMQDVADAAGVAVQTVYYTFKTKAQLLTQVEAFAVMGDGGRETTLAERINASPSVDDLLTAFVAMDTDIKARLAPFVAAAGPALPSDPQTVARREQGRAGFFKVFIDRLAELASLRAGLTDVRALEILLAVNSLPVYIELTQRRGWSNREWESWLTHTIRTQLLPYRA